MRLFDDLPSAGLIWFKGGLFAFLGVLSGIVLITRLSQWWDALILAICIWSFCRAYYFAFYVVEHWIDEDFKFSGLSAFATYWWNKRRGR
ncbi:hypothetical protein [Rhodopirellula sp. MGV]|uniref:hypothetical protein n=1 Tax=Rhodopirellula sp. MGV TaxID=2023130 RepID=UPI000B96436A|nr:hypothetical protein [Rhodopirellula sp. MGV]OYP36662.1 hypothetical protein CGZ80_07710 [Rhodopirellula sp. MGV]PNY36091.1 hypothetical protein C2E31_14660 [Rhodopirellula baltica]PNY36117.1 hypothetical protein C2E31_14805 [Rhodopirellula baltica]